MNVLAHTLNPSKSPFPFILYENNTNTIATVHVLKDAIELCPRTFQPPDPIHRVSLRFVQIF